MLVTTGLHDSQVQYWEPAKWVARLRLHKEDDTVLFLETNMKAGHGGASGRFSALKETAKKYAFLLALENTVDWYFLIKFAQILIFKTTIWLLAYKRIQTY